jgi:hypothetical protein
MVCRLDDFGTSPLFFMDKTQTIRGGGFLQACEKGGPSGKAAFRAI